MGKKLFDQYSFLHFCVGGAMFYLNMSFLTAIIIHTIFEFVENTRDGIHFINRFFSSKGIFRWPGGKNYSDLLINNIGDTISFIIGWYIASVFDYYGKKYEWHNVR